MESGFVLLAAMVAVLLWLGKRIVAGLAGIAGFFYPSDEPLTKL